MIEKYPENLTTKDDEWGGYNAVWGSAPNEVVQLLVESYQTIYPEYEFDWTKMVGTLGRANAQESIIQMLLDLMQDSFPDKTIDWDRVREKEFSSNRTGPL